MTMDVLTTVCTTVITYVFGECAKKWNWIETKYIPVQNLLIGVVIGALAFILDLNDNIISSIILCLAGSFCAGGTYDLAKTKE